MTIDLNTLPDSFAGTWTNEPSRHQLSIAVEHAHVGTIRGRFADDEGELVVRPDLGDCRVMLLIDAASVHTGPPVLDQRLRSPAFLDTNAYRYIWFHTTRVLADPDNRRDQILVTGELIIRAV